MILRQTLKRGSAAVVACVGLAGLMISCDSDFDLSNINTDITVGGSIAAPIGTTDTLTLSRLIDLTDNLKVDENGAYALTSNGSTVLDIDRIDRVQIKDLSTTPEYFNFSVPSIPGTLPTLDLTTPMSVTMTINAIQNMPTEVERITSLSVSPVVTTVHLKLTAPGLSKITGAGVKDFVMDFPDMLQFGAGIEGMDYNTNKLTVNKKFASDGSLSVALPIVGMRQLPDIRNHKMTVDERVVCNGTFEGVANGVTAADLAGMQLTFVYDVPDFQIEDIHGTVDADVVIKPETVNMGDLPDLVTDESTSLNLNTICLKLDVSNPVGVPFGADLTLRALDKNGRYINETVTAHIDVNAGTTEPVVTKLLLTNSDKMTEPGYTKFFVPNLAKLVNKIPSEVEINADVNVDKTKEHHIILGKTYHSSVEYVAYMPFDFGAGSHIIYRDGVDGLADDIKDFSDKVKNLDLEIDADIYSTVPFDVAVSITPRDVEGNDLSDVIEYTKTVNVSPGAEGQAAQKRTITLKEKEEGAIGRLDKIDIVVEGNTSDAVTVLKPTQYVLVGLKARLPQGVTIKN